MRQSSVNQVRQHQESTELQYRLVDRAIGLGWPPERVQVIDEDLGKSGAGGVDATLPHAEEKRSSLRVDSDRKSLCLQRRLEGQFYITKY